MKKIRITTLLLAMLFVCQQGIAQIQKAAKAVFTLTTFDKDGGILASSHGVFVSADGDAISTWTPFVGASSAVVIDASGRKMNVKYMLGANEIYDVCKFKVDGRTTPAPVSQSASTANSKVWLVGYSVDKPAISQRSVQKVEQFMDKYAYYIFSDNAPDNASSCPFVNQKGEVIGLLQHSKTGGELYATDARFINSFKIEKGLSINDAVLRQTGIRMALPDRLEEATLALMLSAQSSDSIKRAGYVSDFILRFPQSTEGYYRRAADYVSQNLFDQAAADMENCIRNASAKDEAHFCYSKLIYEKEIYKSQTPYQAWSLDKALEEARKAYEINPSPIYQHQQAKIIYTQKDFPKAYDLFMALTKTPIRNGELFYGAAQCKMQLKAPQNEILTLLDSAVNAQPKANSAPYYLARGQYLALVGETRKAVDDFNVYDTLVIGRGSAEFYYLKYQSEVKLRRYQQALNDIAHAIVLNRAEPTYYAEMANLQIRINKPEDAIKTIDICISLAPEYADAYLIKGLALIQNKQVPDGIQQLQKAKDLGDPRAQEMIDKYK
ncbi:MAG: hypothetical protein MSD82_04350 [Prevotella sp.]|nr:hypothetical protein [Prevotella sp.]